MREVVVERLLVFLGTCEEYGKKRRMTNTKKRTMNVAKKKYCLFLGRLSPLSLEESWKAKDPRTNE